LPLAQTKEARLHAVAVLRLKMVAVMKTIPNWHSMMKQGQGEKQDDLQSQSGC
jgi:hypothetical protein